MVEVVGWVWIVGSNSLTCPHTPYHSPSQRALPHPTPPHYTLPPQRDERDLDREERHRRAEERRQALLAQSVAERQAKDDERRNAAHRRRLAEAHRRVAAFESERQRQVEKEKQRLAARRQMLEAELGAVMAEGKYEEAFKAAYPGQPVPRGGREGDVGVARSGGARMGQEGAGRGQGR